MKRSITLLLTTALVIPPLFGEEKARPEKGRADGSFFKSIDKDGDKAISKEEAGEHWERLSRLDANDDGKVTFEEIAAGRPGGGEGSGRPGPGKDGEPGEPGEIFKRLDKNGDGSLSKDEVPEQSWERLSKFDKDSDGVVTKEEMAAGFALMRAAKGGEGGDGKGARRGTGGPLESGPGAAFGRFDKDNDGKLSESEVPAEMWSKLRKADTDGDGLVSREELEKVYKDLEAFRG